MARPGCNGMDGMACRRLGLAGRYLDGVGMWTPTTVGIRQLAHENHGLGWFSMACGILGLFGLIPAMSLILFDLAIATRHSRSAVECRHGRLYARE